MTTRLTLSQFISFFRWYKGLPHQDLALSILYKDMDPELLQDYADWVIQYRDDAVEEQPQRTVVLSGKENELSWGGVLAMARKAGAKFPEVAAAQLVLESGWFKHESGVNNIAGIKAAEGEPHTVYYAGVERQQDGHDPGQVQGFDSHQECVNQLVDQWYKDFRGYKGVNRALSVGECCALLVAEGYATDPHYAAKLMSIINQQAG